MLQLLPLAVRITSPNKGFGSQLPSYSREGSGVVILAKGQLIS